MTTDHIDTTNNSIVRAAIDIIANGHLNFDTVGGSPTNQYSVEIEAVVYEFDHSLPDTWAVT